MTQESRIPEHMRLKEPTRLREAKFTAAMGAELEFYFQQSAGAMGERSAYGAFVDQAMSGTTKGGVVGDDSAMIARLGAAAKVKRVREALANLSPKTQKILAGKYDVGGHAARVAADLVPGLAHPGVAYVIEGRRKLAGLAERLRTPDKGDENQRAKAKAIRDEARVYLRGCKEKGRESVGLNERCAEAIKQAEASYATFRAYLSPRLPKRAPLELQDVMRELEEAMGPPISNDRPAFVYEHQPVMRTAAKVES